MLGLAVYLVGSWLVLTRGRPKYYAALCTTFLFVVQSLRGVDLVALLTSCVIIFAIWALFFSIADRLSDRQGWAIGVIAMGGITLGLILLYASL